MGTGATSQLGNYQPHLRPIIKTADYGAVDYRFDANNGVFHPGVLWASNTKKLAK
ncbi:MAG: hypothetical protein U0905_20220 [Pirellulales bacterium]